MKCFICETEGRRALFLLNKVRRISVRIPNGVGIFGIFYYSYWSQNLLIFVQIFREVVFSLPTLFPQCNGLISLPVSVWYDSTNLLHRLELGPLNFSHELDI